MSPAIESLEFGQLPLLRVEYSLQVEPIAPASLDDLCQLRAAFREELPQVTDFGGPSSGFSINMGSAMGAGFDNLATGVGLAVRAERVFAAWQRLRPETAYVRFETLRSLLTKALSLQHHRTPTQAYGFYANRVPREHGTPKELLIPSLFGQLNGVSPKDLRVTWELNGGDYRLNVYAVEDGWMLETLFIVPCVDPTESLDMVHRTLLETFHAIITDKARTIWQLKP